MKKIRFCAIATVISLLSSIFGMTCLADESESVSTADSPVYTEASLSGWNSYSPDTSAGDIEIDLLKTTVGGSSVGSLPLTLEKENALSVSVELQAEAEYYVLVNYRANGENNKGLQFEITVNSDMVVLAGLPVLWSDASKSYELDINGNEIIPRQTAINEFISDFFFDSGDIGSELLKLNLKSGHNVINIKNNSTNTEIQSISLIRSISSDTYEEYKKAYSGFENVSELLITEGEAYTLKTESYIRGGLSKNASLTPHKRGKKCVATLEGGSWDTAGQKVIWEFNVEKTGFYQLAYHYSQSSNADKPVFRRIEIDGEVPFTEFETVLFPATDTNDFENYTLTDINNNPFEIYLEKGLHTISMQVTLGNLREIYDEILSVMNEINNIGMRLQKLSAGSVDSNRTWDMDIVMPDAVPALEEIAERIDRIYDRICEVTDSKSSFADSLVYASSLLKKLLEKPRVLPNKLELLNVGDNSVTKFLGDVLSQLISSPLSIDRIYFTSGVEMPSAKAGVFSVLAEGIHEFFCTFTKDYVMYSSDGSDNSDQLKVWVNRSVQYTETMQGLLDETFNKDNKTNIQLSIMPNEQKLILANASGTNPDVVLGIGYATPFNFAIRNSAKNLLEYEDFLSFYSEQYNLESLTPMCYNDGVYGAIETQNFNVLFYRKDIFDSLELTVPDTWEDVKYLMPTLLRHQMNFYIPLSSSNGYKSFAVTSPFIFQSGASILENDGFSVAYRSDKFKKSLHEMTELYTIYGMQQAVPSLYNSFRYGEIPVAIGDMSLYLQLTYAAPELSGSWDTALSPGTVIDGEVVRYQSADSTACMIFKNTKNSDLAWEFLKWWLSEDIQAEYAQLLTSTYGPEYFWSTANLKAFERLPLADSHKEIILEQWKWQKEVMYHPANYMIERDISNIWNNIVVNGMDFSDAVDNAVASSNREILRKLLEFGYCDENGKKLKDYVTNPDRILSANK